MAFLQGTFLDHSVEEVKYSDFINHELILFSRADLQRSIPGLLDGFKPGQRKILYSAFKRKLKTDLKVGRRPARTAAAPSHRHGGHPCGGECAGVRRRILTQRLRPSAELPGVWTLS